MVPSFNSAKYQPIYCFQTMQQRNDVLKCNYIYYIILYYKYKDKVCRLDWSIALAATWNNSRLFNFCMIMTEFFYESSQNYVNKSEYAILLLSMNINVIFWVVSKWSFPFISLLISFRTITNKISFEKTYLCS